MTDATGTDPTDPTGTDTTGTDMTDPTGTDATDKDTTMDNPTPNPEDLLADLDTVGMTEITLPNGVIAEPVNTLGEDTLGEDAVLVAFYTVDDTEDDTETVDRFTSVSLVPVAGAVSILNAVREALRIIAELKGMTIDELARDGEYTDITQRANGSGDAGGAGHA